MRNTKSVSIGFPSILWVVLILGLLLILGALPVLAASSPFSEAAPIDSYVLDTERPEVLCALLDDPAAREKMSGMFETKLLNACGRADELGRVAAPAAPAPFAPLLGPDVQVNDSTGESGATATQSETSLALNENTGTLCSGYNDSYSGVILGQGYTGFSNSTDGGATFTDRGALSSSSFGDPSLIWRRTDGKFYIAALHSSGLGIWRTDDDCETFVFHAMIHSGGGDDKELMAVDNNPASPYYGRIYTAWTDFNAGANIYSTYSDDGLTWSTPVLISNSGTDVQGAWPVVAPNGDVYVSWVRWNPYSTGPIDIEVVRSTNGGTSFSFVTNPLTGAVNPYDNTATSSCGRPALNGNIRYLPSPQIAVSPNGNLHVVYSYDPDGNGTGDVVDVFYRRSTDNGATWGPEVQLNDDGTTTDQWFPTVSAGPSGRIIATWYDRRSDVGGNYLFEYYMRVSEDGGATWQPSVLVSDVQSPVYLDPNLATCYHGDYDTQVQDASYAYIQWSDDRLMLSGHNDPDVWMDTNAFAPDFTLDAAPLSQAICVPGPAYYNLDIGQILSYTDPVTLSTSGVPGGYSDSYSTNPVIPPGTSVLTLTNIGAATPGAYSIDIIGTAPTSTHTATVGLDLYNTIPAAPTLVAPGDGAIDVPLVPTFSWTAVSQGALYDLEVAEDSGFTTLVYTSTVAGTSDTSGVALAPVTTYYWRVTPSNACGAGTTSAVFSFTTQDIPPVLLVDDDDNSPDVQGTYTAVLDNLLGPGNYDIWDTNNSDMEPTVLDLAPYTTVIWFTGDEFGGFAGPGAAGEAALSSWLDGGNCMLISSQDYLYDRGLTPFIDNYLGVASYTSDVAQTSVTGAGSVYSVVGGPHTLSYPGSNFSDLITPDAAPAELAFSGNAGDAAVDKDSGVYRTAFLGYPFEALPAGAVQEDVMLTTLNWCGSGAATGTLAGSVSDIDSGLGIDGAAVTAVSGAYMRTVPTDGAGDYTMQVPIGTYDVTADATGYLSDTVTAVVVITDTTTVVDFVLQGSMLSYSPASIEEFMEVGDIVTNTVTVTNTGPVAIDWSASIGNYTPTVSMPLQVIPRGISVPASDGNFPRGAAAPSFGAPPALKEGSAPASAGQLRVPDGTSAYATDAGLGQVRPV